jgi:uncharacterized membrane protein SpoIIM required for sporulation
VAAFGAVLAEPSLGNAFSPPGYVEQVDKTFGESFGKEARGSGMGALATSFYIVNNVKVAFFAFASGAFLGLGSATILVFNGVILGAVGAVIRQHGLSYNFWSFVASHGGIEMGAIVLAGAAGMRVGFALLNPGLRTRKAALAEAGREAGILMFGVVAMLLSAAMLEAWVSPSTLPNGLKLTFGALNLAASSPISAWPAAPEASPPTVVAENPPPSTDAPPGPVSWGETRDDHDEDDSARGAGGGCCPLLKTLRSTARISAAGSSRAARRRASGRSERPRSIRPTRTRSSSPRGQRDGQRRRAQLRHLHRGEVGRRPHRGRGDGREGAEFRACT